MNKSEMKKEGRKVGTSRNMFQFKPKVICLISPGYCRFGHSNTCFFDHKDCPVAKPIYTLYIMSVHHTHLVSIPPPGMFLEQNSTPIFNKISELYLIAAPFLKQYRITHQIAQSPFV